MSRKTILVIILLIVSIKYGFNYILSEKFQTYGDQKKAPWTCRVNNFLGGFFEIMSDYGRSNGLYERVLARCPETSMAEYASFQKAACFEALNQPSEAMAAYQYYLDTFETGQKRGNAVRAVDRIRFSR